MNRQQELENTSIGRLLLKYSIPAIIGMLVNALYNVVDRGFIGNIPDVGNAAMAGVVITMPIVTIILGFSIHICIVKTLSSNIIGSNLIEISLKKSDLYKYNHTGINNLLFFKLILK